MIVATDVSLGNPGRHAPQARFISDQFSIAIRRGLLVDADIEVAAVQLARSHSATCVLERLARLADARALTRKAGLKKRRRENPGINRKRGAA